VSVAGKPSFVLAVTGLRAEARIAERSVGVKTIAGGGDAQRLADLIGQAIANGAGALVSFGIAAGLSPTLAAGSCVVAGKVVREGKSYATNADWSVAIKQAVGVAELVTIAGVDHVLQSQAEKAALYAKSGAVAADMESHIVARLAAKHGLPFAVLRAIADPVSRAIPTAALAGMGTDGHVKIGAVLLSLAGNPAQLPALLHLAADTRQAFRTLLRCHDLLGPRLGCRDLG
jgi:hopanoid-associated phosphorylase